MEHGRPQKYTKEFIEKEGEELLKWVQIDSNMYLSKFCFDRGYSSPRLLEWAKEYKTFSSVLDSARDFLNAKVREKLNAGQYNERMALRDISHYDRILKHSEREDMAYASSLKSNEATAQAETLDKLVKLAKSGDISQK